MQKKLNSELEKILLSKRKEFDKIIEDKISDKKLLKDIKEDFYENFNLDKDMVKTSLLLTNDNFTLINNLNWIEKDYPIALEEMDSSTFSNKEMLSLFKHNLKKKEAKKDIKINYNDIYQSEFISAYLLLFDAKRKLIIDELYKKLDEIAKMTKNLKVMSDFLGRFWDLSLSDLVYMDMDFVKRMSQLLKQNDFIKRIAELLGRLASSNREYEDKIIKESKFIPSNKKFFKTPINTIGVTQGSTIVNLLPHQFGYRHHKKLKLIFNKNLIENKLLEFDRKDKLLDEVETHRTERIFKEDSRGPFIICIDTSGSMHGEPETIAKAMAMALVNIANKQKRKCFIYTFSTRLTSFDATNLGKSWNNFYEFLSLRASGGTDIEPAIEGAVKKTLENGYKNADVIFISDLIINHLDPKILKDIKASKKNKVRYHSLTIGNSYNNSAIDFLDNNWIYDGSKKSINKIIWSLENNLLKNAKNKDIQE